MSVPAPHLALVPPSPPPPVQILPKPGPITAERLRRVAVAAGLTGAALPPVATLLGAFLGEWRIAVYVLCFVILLPSAALVLGIELLVNRTLADLRACLLGVLSLAGCLMLTAMASTASVELFVAVRQPALDRLATDAHAFYLAQRAHGAGVVAAYETTTNHFAAPAADAGVEIAWIQPAKVGVRITGFEGNEVVRVWPGADASCGRGSVRFLGGAWYHERCPQASYSD